MKRKKTKKIRKKNKKSRPRKKFKKPAFKRKKIGRRKKRVRNVRKKKKKLNIRKKAKRIKITRKIKSPGTANQLAQLKELTVKKVLSFVFRPFTKFFEQLQEKRKLKKLKKIENQIKEKKRREDSEEKLKIHLKEQELLDEKRIAKMISQELKGFIRNDLALLRREQAIKRRRFLESIRLSKQIEKLRRREKTHIMRAEMQALKNERDSYSEIKDKVEAIRIKYKQIRENKIKARIIALGVQSTGGDTLEDLYKKEKEFNEKRKKAEVVLESFFRSAQSLIFQLNKRWIPRHMSILRVIDKRWEENLFYIRYDDESENEYKMLISLEEGQNLDQESIIVEDKTDETYITKSFSTNSIFAYSDWMVDRWVNHLDRSRKKKAS